MLRRSSCIVVAILLGCLVSVPDALASGLQVAPTFLVGGAPGAMAAGDFNGDGKLDLAVVDTIVNAPPSPGAVSILLGNGAGSFKRKVDYQVGEEPVAIILGDFNNDGITDIVTANVEDSTLSVLLGKGDGTFANALSMATTSLPVALAAADFNHDGFLDLVITNDTTTMEMLGNGDGTFKAGKTVHLGASPDRVLAADVNGDGNADLVATNVDTYDNRVGVSVALGNGDGTFSAATFYSTANTPESLTIADLNLDGTDDLVVANANGIAILLGLGGGVFHPAVQINDSLLPLQATVGDFNHDGIPDLAILSRGGVALAQGVGDGTFRPPSAIFAAGVEPGALATGDFNGDNNLDIVVANFSTDQTSSSTFPYGVSLLLGNANGTLRAATDYYDGDYTTEPYWTVVGDFNGDGVPDLAVANVYPEGYAILLGKGKGAFQPAKTYSLSDPPTAVATADFNHDGKLDLAFVENGLTIFSGRGDGTFSGPTSYSVSNSASAIAIGDFNADGNLDVVLTDIFTKFVHVLLGNSDGTFRTAVDYKSGGASESIVVADFNGDGHLDLALPLINPSQAGFAAVLLGNGDGSFQAPVLYPVQVSALGIAAGDFNGDGIVDLAVTNSCGADTTCSSPGTVTILMGRGDGTFVQGGNLTVQYRPFFVLAADFNGHGHLDLAVTNTYTNSVSLLLGNGNGTFGPPKNLQTDKYPFFAATGDFNQDGLPDLVVNDLYDGDLTVLLSKK